MKVPTGNAPSLRVFVLFVTGVVLMTKGIFVPTGKFVAAAVLNPMLSVDVPPPGAPAVLPILMVRLRVPPAVDVKVAVVVPVTL